MYGRPDDPDHGIEAFDWFPPQTFNLSSIQMFVFVHGGGWQLFNLEESSYWATPVTEAGAIFVSLSYRLCPWQSIQSMIYQLCKGMCKVYDHTVERIEQEIGINAPDVNISLVGYSAGGHLVAEMIAQADEFLDENRRWLNRVKNVITISGAFDLRPFVHTAWNKAVGFKSTEEAWSVSPLRHFTELVTSRPIRSASLRWLICFSEYDPPTMIDQSMRFAEAIRSYRLSSAGKVCAEFGAIEAYCLAGEDHCSSVLSLYYGVERSPLLRRIMEFVGLLKNPVTD
ncbi:unnamed protein product [Calicophoron daubneyi]|uniref:Alpha/beta hydrolase fold-3 domain-containing protein n=1 Tax=Calicophoron daubneyi TaxID=300641 RepID=A0AAV2TJI9_CALDB